MTEKSSQEDGISRREFMVAAGAAAVVGSALQRRNTATAAAPANEICRMDAVTLADKIRTKQLSPTEVTEAVLARMDKVNPIAGRILHALTGCRASTGEGGRGGHHGRQERGPTRRGAGWHQGLGLH